MKVRAFEHQGDQFKCLTNDLAVSIAKLFAEYRVAGWSGHTALTAKGEPYALLWKKKEAPCEK